MDARYPLLLVLLALGSKVCAEPARGSRPVTTAAELDAALASMEALRVRDLPPAIYARDGYSRRYDHLRIYRVTEKTRRMPLVWDRPVEDFLSPEFRFVDSWLYKPLGVPREGDRYLLIQRRILLKLLHLLRFLTSRRYRSDGFFIVSAHRTERVNRHLYRFRMRTFGKTTLSRRSHHLTGRALDLIVGDLDGDGRIDALDHRVLACAIRAVERARPRLAGGLGLYARSIHVDVRGRRASWCGKGGNRGPLCRRPWRRGCRRLLRHRLAR